MPPTIDMPRVHTLYRGPQVTNDPSLLPISKARGGVGAGCKDLKA